MFLGILAFVLVILGAVSHYRSGLWSAILTLWSALLAGAIAFGFYLPLSAALFPMGDLGSKAYYWGDGLMLLLLFIVSFGVLRILVEQLLRSAMTFRAIIDTIGGVVIGAVSGYVMAGVLAVFAQMMPLAPTSVLGYEPFELKTGNRVGRLFTRADDAVLGLYNGVLGGALAGQEGGLAAAYPSSDASTEDGSAERRRGRGVDDILHYYFRRRLEYTYVVNDDLGPFKTSPRKGVAVTGGRDATFNPGRSVVPTKIRVEKAWLEPYREWAGRWCDPATGQKKPALEWASQNDDVVKVDAKEVDDYAVLLVRLTFCPETDTAYSLSLSDWELVSEYKSPASKPMEFPRAKLVGSAKVTQEGAGVGVTPLDSVGTEKKPAILDGRSVDVEGRQPAQAPQEKAQALFLAKSAVWNFDDSTRRAKATLAFLVPPLSMPWQYGLKCGGVAPKTSGGSAAKKGLVAGRKDPVGPFKMMRILDVQRVSALPGVKKEAAEGKELLVVGIELTKSAKESMLLTQDDWPLTNVALKEEYPGSLLETIEIKDGEQKVANVSLRKADVMAKGGETVMNEAGDKGQRLSPDWEVFFLEGSGKAEFELVYEVPRGKPFSQYDFQVGDDLEAEPPEWYLLRNLMPMRSSTHLVEYDDSDVAEEVPLRLSSGKIVSFKAAAASGAEMLVVTLLISPKNEGDRSYYELKVGDIDLKAVKGPKAGRVIPIHSLRFADEEAFHPPAPDDVLTIRGEKKLQIAFYVTKDREEMSLTVKGFKAMDVD